MGGKLSLPLPFSPTGCGRGRFILHFALCILHSACCPYLFTFHSYLLPSLHSFHRKRSTLPPRGRLSSLPLPFSPTGCGRGRFILHFALCILHSACCPYLFTFHSYLLPFLYASVFLRITSLPRQEKGREASSLSVIESRSSVVSSSIIFSLK